ncbi:hypothetical protein [Peribacillus simplex]|uniref:Uncharacterized protein n=1 Tax=Peribacillus simplex TaxID=1478 RepID=A0A9W4L5B6_9BACI|nr:hypothetical protein [Peribacillus simplex]WHX93536.1 hypothetical protein QNH50_12245 [Peribacillus simplex]CAH0261800.1 hypothetical protein SRABI133_03410 [Peribacillus simplex]
MVHVDLLITNANVLTLDKKSRIISKKMGPNYCSSLSVVFDGVNIVGAKFDAEFD